MFYRTPVSVYWMLTGAMLATVAYLSQIEAPQQSIPLRACELKARHVPFCGCCLLVTNLRILLSDRSLDARLCSPGFCEGLINSQWNSVITVLVPSLRRVAAGGLSVASQCSYVNRSVHNYCSGNRLAVNAASRQLIGPSVLRGLANVRWQRKMTQLKVCATVKRLNQTFFVGQIYSPESNPSTRVGDISELRELSGNLSRGAFSPLFGV
jgi:hypothetical protein